MHKHNEHRSEPKTYPMIIRCPNCNTGYNLPVEKLGKGRTVKCTQCAHSWFQEKITPAEENPTPPTAETTTEKPPLPAENDQLNTVAVKTNAENKANKKRLALILTAAISTVGIIIIAIVLLASNFKNEGPVVGDMYGAIGLEKHNTNMQNHGLHLPTEKIERTLSEAEPTTLTFTGVVQNPNEAEVTIPRIVVALYNEQGLLLDKWPAYVAKRTLKPGEEVKWTCRFFNPPLEKISEHRVTFEIRTSTMPTK